MAPPSLSSAALACMQEIQEQCFELGIPLRTRHREVAPNQYEFAPMYGYVTTQIDQNLMVMQIIDEVSVKYGLAALMNEKPFQGVNGSGKHNNWSLAANDGTNLLNVEELARNSGSDDIFPVVMAAIVKAIDKYGDLMRLSVASPGNDFRLGACKFVFLVAMCIKTCFLSFPPIFTRSLTYLLVCLLLQARLHRR